MILNFEFFNYITVFVISEKSDYHLLNRIIKLGNDAATLSTGKSAFHPFIPEEPPVAHQNNRDGLLPNLRIDYGNSLPEAHQNNNRKDVQEMSSLLNYNSRLFSGMITTGIPQHTTLLQLPSAHHLYSS